MGYVGVSLILASVVWVIVAPPPWIHPFMPPFLLTWRHLKPPPALPPSQKSGSPGEEATKQDGRTINPATKEEHQPRDAPPTLNPPQDPVAAQARAAMPPPAVSLSRPEPEPEEQTTPKAKPSAPAAPVPSFTLEAPSSHTPSTALSPSATAAAPGRGSMPPPPAPSSNINMMPPPPPPQLPPQSHHKHYILVTRFHCTRCRGGPTT
ncbi:uncharacterized protein GLRG_07006 [Colletotrichum graminicola M1.001]|uniref:Uncharacterized protein n=1 Tax=Colletotrichum graminicola (strain M1.001 / M2 / FGSC 10212) TaxID=645133 RepID=E3QLX4_COLGM|nr:uncharacterized protein GLRG_07006 [Colletotrichum graminicola M1.001]EFQ31862.1 hypothetical protein GLRG_07006 [Colletotrichum graminicola M1.001]